MIGSIYGHRPEELARQRDADRGPRCYPVARPRRPRVLLVLTRGGPTPKLAPELCAFRPRRSSHTKGTPTPAEGVCCVVAPLRKGPPRKGAPGRPPRHCEQLRQDYRPLSPRMGAFGIGTAGQLGADGVALPNLCGDATAWSHGEGTPLWSLCRRSGT